MNSQKIQHRRSARIGQPLRYALVAFALCCVTAASTTKAVAPPPDDDGLVIKKSKATGTACFIKGRNGNDIHVPIPADKAAADPIDFFNTHGKLFGIHNPQAQLVIKKTRTDTLNHKHTTCQQVYHGVPVFGAILRVHTNAAGKIQAVNGSSVADIKVNPVPTLPADIASTVAIDRVAQQAPKGANLTAANTTLYIYRTNLARGIPGDNHLAWEVEVTGGPGIREFVYVDAHDGNVIDQITGIHHSIHRRIYNGGLSPSLLVWQEGNPLPYTGSDATGINELIDFAEDTYNLYATLSNGTFLSYDGADAIMHSVLNDPSINCPNANWNGASTNFCNGVTGDDTVAHEWAHAYTDFTHNLIYAWQPGALNEGYSDIFGEVVDLLNSAGSDVPGTLRSDGGCSTLGMGFPSVDNSYRWLAGEDDFAFGGAIRDMWNPNCYGDPGKVSDFEYQCSDFDYGGVHTNSGVPCHAFALLVDGGTYNGRTINGIGLTKAAHIYWRASSVYQGPATGFPEHADALEQACTDLIGVNLPGLSTESPSPFLSGEIITSADCNVELANVIEAVEYRVVPTQCGFTLLLDPDAPPLCDQMGSVQTVFQADFESGLGAWSVDTHSVDSPNDFDTPDWAVVGNLPNGRTGSAAFVIDDPSLGNCSTDIEAGVLYLESPPIAMPSSAFVPRLAFDHWVSTEALWDGGNVKIRVNAGSWTLIPQDAFDFNAYNDVLNGGINDNPLAGEPAFTGSNDGSLSGSWGQSQISLLDFAAPYDTIQLRFEMGLDGCNGRIGWYVDDVHIYACTGEAPGANCGNALLDVFENCDDGNATPGDGCSEMCIVEEGWTCTDPIPPGPGPNAVDDPSFEAGPFAGFWAEASTNFDTPLWNSTLSGPVASDGIYHAWFGGINTYEAGSITQTITIPAGTATLEFDLLVGYCDSQSDYLDVRIDGDLVFTTDPCLPNGNYTPQTIDVTNYADGGNHILRFESEIFVYSGMWSNFFVDRVSVRSEQSDTGEPSVCTSDLPLLIAAASRRQHSDCSAFDLDCPLEGPPAMEPRQDGIAPQMVLTFDRPAPEVGCLAVEITNGSCIGTATLGNDLIVVMNFDKNACVTVSVVDTLGSASVIAHEGNINGDDTIDVLDLQDLKNHVFEPVGPDNFLYDINADCSINVVDLQQTKNNVFTQVYCP